MAIIDPKTPLGQESAVSHNEKVARLFFLPGSQHFDAFTEKEIPNSIQVWLNRFNIAHKDFAPILAISIASSPEIRWKKKLTL